jgi:hypothetical protein
MNAGLAELCDLLRSKGVRRYVGQFNSSVCELEFFPAEPPPLKDGPPKKDAEACNCGHPLHHHNNSLCLIGCTPDKCLGPDGAP